MDNLVLVCFHTAIRNTTWDWLIYKGKRFNWLTVPHGYRGLRKLTVMAEGEGEARHILHGGSRREPNTFKPSDLLRTHCHKNSMGKTAPMGIFNPWGLQFEMRFGWGHRAKPYQATSQEMLAITGSWKRQGTDSLLEPLEEYSPADNLISTQWNWFQISGLQTCERINLCCLCYKVCGNLLQQPEGIWGGCKEWCKLC